MAYSAQKMLKNKETQGITIIYFILQVHKSLQEHDVNEQHQLINLQKKQQQNLYYVLNIVPYTQLVDHLGTIPLASKLNHS